MSSMILGQIKQKGFTIVELVIVIAVIGIMATITVVGYGAWRTTVAKTEVKSDLNGVVAAMESTRNFNNGYPTSIPSSFTASENVQLTYVSGSDKYYCVTAKSKSVASVVFYINSNKNMQSPKEGECTPIDTGQTLFVFDTTLSGCTANTVQLPVSSPAGSAGSTIYWEDGVSQSFTTALQSHTFAGPGQYTVAYDGPITTIDTTSIGAGSRPCLSSVQQWSSGATPTSMSFRNSTKLSYVAEPPSSVTNMSNMFYGASAFNQPIGSWNTANVTNMSYMFYYASAFNQPIGSWNTASVTNMSGMFRFASVFNQPISTWNTAAVTNMNYMFYVASAFNQPISTWNTAGVTTMSHMFQAASVFNQPIDSWTTAAVTNMTYMFEGASAFNQPISTWNTASVTTMSYMFSSASAFNQPIGSWITAGVTNMSYMFRSATAFNQPIDSWTTAAVTDMSYMFYGATAFNQPIGSWNTIKVTNMDYMFYSANVFNRDLSTWSVSALPTHVSFSTGANAWTLPKPAFLN